MISNETTTPGNRAASATAESEGATVTERQTERASLYCALDDIEERGTDAILTGWMLLPDGPPDAILVRDGASRRSDDAGVYEAEPRERADLATVLPGIEGVDRSGFSVTVPREAFRDAGGGYVFRFVAVRDGDAVGGHAVPWHPQGEPYPSPPEALMIRTAGCGSRTFRVRGGIAASAVGRAVERVLGAAGAPARILELNAGCGWLTRHLERVFPGAERIVTEPDDEVRAWIEESIPGVAIARPSRAGEVGPLATSGGPLADASVEVVLALGAGDLEPDRRHSVLVEAARVLRPGGAAVIAANGPHVGHLLGVDAPPLETFAAAVSDLPLRPVASIEGGLDTLRDLHLLARTSA